MPCLELTTNIRVQDKNKLMRSLSDCVCTGLCKAETYMMVIINDDVPMFFGGNEEPVAHMTLSALGLKDDLIGKLAGDLTEMIQAQTGIESPRIYIVFRDAEPGKWAWDGRTFS
ncbi:phenylpyruvate tautomerase [Desulfomicrobium macestii]|uniref:L-dopachrome isomerase n=1 Tax=Desulfomicrobium macestii TaxID=90731 RepID=A0ABR9GYH7_9BACT|nr:phenylpyruvate tautomerase MIF-related protein [Desulfomicrobium macestii]MBE1423388.1 phenylpyruvate tautomerase [Desulfomicrobium macestii]